MKKDIIALKEFFVKRMDKYFDLREKHSENNLEHNKPQWVVLMCEDFHKMIIEFGGNATLDKVMIKETNACGHTDYSSKFALYCAELCLVD